MPQTHSAGLSLPTVHHTTHYTVAYYESDVAVQAVHMQKTREQRKAHSGQLRKTIYKGYAEAAPASYCIIQTRKIYHNGPLEQLLHDFKRPHRQA